MFDATINLTRCNWDRASNIDFKNRSDLLSERKILSVGFNWPGGEIEHLPLQSNRSLLDADIILFQPGIPFVHKDLNSYDNHYNGKMLLSKTGSFKAVQEAAHWRSELKAAFEEGKTIVIFLVAPDDVFVYTGEKQFSGSGRNRTTTNLVRGFSSYDALPIKFDKVTPKSGEIIVPTPDLKYLSAYWKDFASHSSFEVYFEGEFSQILLTTKTGGKTVGAAIQNKGLFLLIPPLQYDEDFSFYDEELEGEGWTEEAEKFGKRLIAAFVAIDKAVRSVNAVSPAPAWVLDQSLRLEGEARVESLIGEVTSKIEELQNQKADLLLELEAEGGLRRLLYETGHELEAAILESLRLMGFTAETFADGESEFDAVFISPEGRFLGEAEGKDTKPVNIDKLSQLERNLQEDYTRDEVSDYAKGVLFGNAYRLTAPEARADAFTAKCLSGARRSKVALVRTPDLFPVAKYLKENPNEEFARNCRAAIAAAEGEVVQFPSVPVADVQEIAYVSVAEGE